MIITLLIPGIMPVTVAAAEDIPSEDDGNMTILLPDLVIEDLFWNPVNPETGEQVTITATVKNQGNATSGATNLVFYSNGSQIGESSVPEIEAVNSEQISFSWISETESTVEISAKVDEKDSVEEINEDNNVRTAGDITFKKNRLPDLIIDTFDYPENPRPGKHQNMLISVKNQGTAASEKTMLTLYINGSAVSWDVPRLSREESSYAYYTWIPIEEKESVEIRAVVDEGYLIAESNEENNEKTATVTVAEEFIPDLIIEDIVPESAEGEVGKTLNLTLKVKNQGTFPSEEVRAKYYINGIAPTQDDIQIPALSKGEGADVIFSLVPDREGQMEVRAIIDSGTDVYESNEDNNQFTKIIDVKTILPDLIVESLSLNPEAPRIGDDITFTISIKNNGLRDSASSELKYYINGNNVTQTGKVSIPEIAIGETTKGTFHWVPEAEGNVNVRMVADDGNVIREDDETNNERTETVSISKQTTPGNEGSSDSSLGSSSGSSSSRKSSSMGSGVSKEPAKNVEIKELDTRNIMSGYHVKYDFPKNVTCITYIEFDPQKTFKKTTATVEVLKGKSIFVKKQPPGRIYRQLNIWLGNKGAGLPASLKNSYTGFKVEKEWIKNNSVDESNITLLWYDSKWQPLSTKKTGEDKNYVYFRAKTPGYSSFAISEYTGEEGTVEGDEDGIQETLRSWNGDGKTILNSSAEREGDTGKKPMGMAKILLAISLPLFMILAEYFVLKKKI
ncbi:CARDB domain-containing protein [Methanosarcina sp. 2.H.A.1B.4]|uniref:CARDB domain-containing protein n=1 Tax=Methanosarcina sp. 2.H.A.1B.4 TaxID=1483600 RepID=UPI001F2297A5|nr:CARDB domain-containing protein [Methanosarcina sp. 2.H.A.1B.4]